jgi:hypothetical protein
MVTPSSESRSAMTTFIVIGAIVLVVAAYGGLDWYLAGRTARRSLVSAKGADVSTQVGAGLVDRQNTQNNFNTSI